MASYNDFLKLLQDIPKTSSASPSSSTPSLTPLETYEQLCFDFPQLSVDDLSSFTSDFLKHVENEKYSTYPLSNKFIHGITYGASKYGGGNNNSTITITKKSNTNTTNNTNTNTTNTNNTNKENTKQSPFYEQYSAINAIVLIKLIRNALRKDKVDDLDAMFSEYFLEENPFDYDNADDTDAVIANLTPSATNKEVVEIPTEVATEQDDDNYVYESCGGSEEYEPFTLPSSENEDKKGDWEHMSRKLAQLCANVAYDRLAHEMPWSDWDVFSDVVEILGAIKAHSYLQLVNVVPNFVFLLRDRMLDKPTMIRGMLQSCLNTLDLNATTVQHVDAQMGVSIFASIVSQKIPNDASNAFFEIVTTNLPFFKQRTSLLLDLSPQDLISLDCANELKGISQTLKWYAQHGNKKGHADRIEETFNSQGVIRDFVALLVKFALLEELNDTRYFILFLSLQFFKFAQFMQQVRPLVDHLISKEFQESFPEEVLVWALAFHIHPVANCNPDVNWLELAEKFANEIFPNLDSKGEWLLDSSVVHKLHTLLGLLAPLREITAPPASLATAKTLLQAGSFLDTKLRQFQTEVEGLHKAARANSKEDKSPEAKKKRKIQKKQRAILAKLQGLLKALVGEQSKKD